MKKENDKTKKRYFLMKTNGFSFRNLCHNLKVLFLPWLILAVFAAVATVGLNFFSSEVDAVTATVSFHYKGIENGLDPNGCEFDKNSIISDEVIESALAASDLPSDMLTQVKDNIRVDSVVSTNAISNITNYESMFSSSSDSWTQDVSDSSFHPSQFIISFNYNHTNLNGEQAAQLLNTIIDEYQNHFLEIYGYNENIGNISGPDSFENNDYLIALDMYSANLLALEEYIKDLADEDVTEFRSETTNYSFSDLYDSAKLIRTVDIDTLTSYILNNGVISDKDVILSYYEYRIENLQFSNETYKYRLDEISASIENYQKDSVIVYDGYDSGSTTITNTSDIYDSMIQEKLNIQDAISSNERFISDMKDRITTIKKISLSTANKDREYVDEKIVELQTKFEDLKENLKITANEYFSEKKFSNAIAVTSPASYSVKHLISSSVNESIRVVIICELLILIAYLLFAIYFCSRDKLRELMKTNNKKINTV